MRVRVRLRARGRVRVRVVVRVRVRVCVCLGACAWGGVCMIESSTQQIHKWREMCSFKFSKPIRRIAIMGNPARSAFHPFHDFLDNRHFNC